MDGIDSTTYLLLLVLLILSAFFSASETAFSAANMIRLRTMSEDGNKRAAQAVKVAEQYDKLIATILIGNNLVNIAISSLVTVAVSFYFRNYAVAISTGISTLAVLTFGEILPKSFAKSNAEQLCMTFAGPLRVLMVAFTPLSWLFLRLMKPFRKKEEGDEQPTITEQELMYMLDTIEEEGVLEEQEKELVQSALEFNDTTVEDILTPRANMVPLDVRLPQGKRILLMSGPNAGGKSVCLKTVGLLQYMMQCGLLVPVSRDSAMGVFKSMFIDIGDEQSIENDLSTYSSHLLNMKSIVKNGDCDSLILIDEFGSGTEPLIGGAIAEALLEEFDEKGINGIITTHYTNLKHYADEAEAIVNGAMLYDRKEMCPLFQLQIGNPGSSFAIEIARKIGLPETVVQNAIDKVGEDVVNYDKHLQDIARDKKYWAQKRQQIRLRDKHIAEIEDKYGAYLENVNTERKEIIRKAKDEAKRILKEANANVENTIRQIKESQADKEKIKQARQKLSDANAMLAKENSDDFDRKVKNMEQRRSKRGSAEPKPENEAIAVGDNVVIAGQSVVGQVEEINAKKAVVSFGQIRTTVDIKRLEKVSRNAVKRMNRTVGFIGTNPVEKMREKRKHFTSEIDIRGMRAEEAVRIVQGYIDDAIMIGIGSVRILHGTGTGALRIAVRQYLATVKEIESYHDEHVQLGGSGITVVEF